MTEYFRIGGWWTEETSSILEFTLLLNNVGQAFCTVIYNITNLQIVSNKKILMIQYRLLLLSFVLFTIACTSQNGKMQSTPHSNHLVHESSPYLLQHANNPVDWHPWGNEALDKAKAGDKMLIVSIGYSACHWCHVMEHESFEDSTVAKLMNDHFVNIKVDREERPDIDDVYMSACHLATGKSCGWPLNAIALPDGRPIWAGTYFPKKNWMEVLDYFIKLRKDDPQKLEEYAQNLTGEIKSAEKIVINSSEQNFKKETLDEITKVFLTNIDFKKGGRNGSPKFPMPNNYQYLLSQYYHTGNTQALEAVTVTLNKMANGGIYDHLGGGFARYSTDDKWKVPHFEKMLYDNSQLVSLYAQAYQAVKNPLYKKVAEETLEFIKRELTDKSGGFYSSLDADSEGEEGKFYVWTATEIDAVFKEEKVNKIFKDYYSIRSGGNWEHKKNILLRSKDIEDIAKDHKITVGELTSIIDQAKTTLMAVRDKRVRPGLDDKILTSWNALMLMAYVDAYKAFGKDEYLEAAKKNANFILKNQLQKDFRLNRNYKDGKSSINAFLDDYALTIQAFTALYEVTFDERWLKEAKGLADYTMAHFFDEADAMFNYTSDIDPPLIARRKELADNVIPGSNSSMAKALFILGTYLYQSDYIEKARQMMQNMEESIITSQQPNFYSNWCSVYQHMMDPPYEVAVVGDNFENLRNELMKNYLPDVLILGGKNEGTLELLEGKLQEGETMIYVCQNKVCKFPVREVEKALGLIGE